MLTLLSLVTISQTPSLRFLGLTITLTGKCTGENYVFRVHNTGSHIPEEELPYIWDAFYKVDKARVRNKNGCGVGLSIVREIVEAHHGIFEAGNDKTGVFFTLMIPVKPTEI